MRKETKNFLSEKCRCVSAIAQANSSTATGLTASADFVLS